ncbi:hypothetical protein DFH09DRAFT_912135, partial [Mycena vulgaris]
MDLRSPSPEPLSPTPPPETTAAGHPIRAKRKTWKLLQQLPEPPPILPEPDIEPLPIADPPPASSSTWVWEALRTTVNTFGLYCEYPSVPTYNPDESLAIPDLSDIPTTTRSNTATLASAKTPFTTLEAPSEAPVSAHEESSVHLRLPTFRNTSVGGLMNWLWTGSSTKSIEEMDKLVDFLQSDEFVKEDIADF